MKFVNCWFVVISSTVMAASPDFRAGASRVDLTPDGPIWLSGYAARTSPSKGVARRIYARALAIESLRDGKAVFISTDLIGLPRHVTDLASANLQKRFNLDRSQIVFNSSHTHTGPMLNRNLPVMEPDDPTERERIRSYTATLASKLEQAAADALSRLVPASLAFDYGKVGFAMNRREKRDTGVVIGVNPNGPVDHRVPVLRVTGGDGKTVAILFGYACHNTTLTQEFYEISGDYAGEAAATLEQKLEGVTALFFELCAGDQNPNPRSKVELAKQHGQALGEEVVRVAAASMQPVSGKIRTSFQDTVLPFAPHTREKFEKDLASSNRFEVRRAKLMLEKYDARQEPRSLTYPVQVIRFDKGFTLVALGGEVVVDYALWCYREFPQERLMVAGYSNDVPCYIPSVRVLREGGYEANQSMIYYGQPGPFTEEVEPRIHDAIRAAMRRVKQ